MTTYFTSDTHFGHARILELGDGRPFLNVDEHNEALIYRWNETVKHYDTVYHLGDVALGLIADSLPLVGRLNGHKLLISGNHDRISTAMSVSQRERFRPIYLEYFDEILPEILTVPLRLDNGWGETESLTLSHYPPTGDSQDKDRYSELRPEHVAGRVYIAGHTHTHDKYTITDLGAIIINVGVDARDYTPVSLDEVLSDIVEARKQTQS